MKEKKFEYVQRIQSHYVSEDCIQIMIPHLGDTISILNSDGMTYHSKPNSYLYINKYVFDPRKNQFPYSQIPTHRDRIKGKKVEFINQIYDFNRVYITISDNMIRENFVVKDGNEALLATKYILPNQEQSQILNRQQFEELFKSANGGIFMLDGSELTNFSLPSNERILNWYKEQLINKRKSEQGCNTYSESELTDYFYKSIERLTIEDVPSDITICEDEILVSIDESNDSKEIKSIKGINAKYMGEDKFIVEIYDFPITIYSLEHLQQLEQISSRKTPEPKFSKLLNKNIKQEEVKKAKKLVLARKKEN